MKLYRCIVGLLMAFFIIVGVWYVVSCYDEQRSIEDGLLIQSQEQNWNKSMRGVLEDVTDNSICEGVGELHCLR